MPEFEIESIRGQEDSEEGVKYLIHWKGYGTDDDTWETREDLVLDGHEDYIQTYENNAEEEDDIAEDAAEGGNADESKSDSSDSSEKLENEVLEVEFEVGEEVVVSTPTNIVRGRNAESKGSRRRSPTPSRRTPAVASPTQKVAVKKEYDPTSARTEEISNVHPSKSSGGIALVVFTLSLGMIVTLRILQDSKLSFVDSTMQESVGTVATFSQVLPALSALLYVYQACEPTPFPMRVCAALLWIGVVHFIEASFSVNPSFSTIFTKNELVYGATLFWQVLYGIAMVTDMKRLSFLVLFFVALVSGATTYFISEVEKEILKELLPVLFTTGCCFQLAFLRITESASESHVADLFATLCAGAIVAADVFDKMNRLPVSLSAKPLYAVTQYAGEDLLMNPAQVAYVGVGWLMCAFMAHSAKSFKNEHSS